MEKRKQTVDGVFFEAEGGGVVMAGAKQTAWVLMALMVLMVIPPSPATLPDTATPQRVAASSDMIADFSQTVAGSAEVVDIAHIGQIGRAHV